MMAIPGYDDWKCSPPEFERLPVRCESCGESCDGDDAERSGWYVSSRDTDECTIGICPVCQEEEVDTDE